MTKQDDACSRKAKRSSPDQPPLPRIQCRQAGRDGADMHCMAGWEGVIGVAGFWDAPSLSMHLAIGSLLRNSPLHHMGQEPRRQERDRNMINLALAICVERVNSGPRAADQGQQQMLVREQGYCFGRLLNSW